MADESVVSDIVTKFLLNTCRLRPRLTRHAIQAALVCSEAATRQADTIPLITGSAAEFYIEPMLPHVGDIDVMNHFSTELAIPRGHPPPTQLPAEFSDYVRVCEIVDSHLPGYVYLQLRYLLTKCIDNDTFKHFAYDNGLYLSLYRSRPAKGDYIHGPAMCRDHSKTSVLLSTDAVHCVRCLSWPPQAADWPTRHRNYDWPDTATADHVVRDGCDVVQVAHRQCKQDEWMSECQWRLSFSRAEIILINSWMPVQQVVYHMLRVFVKSALLANSEANEALSNYHFKTLMLWASEVKSSSFWTYGLNLVRICVELLHTLSVWLTDERCPHYFIASCNLIQNFLGVQLIASQLMSIDEMWLSRWFVNNYIRKCSLLCPDSVSSLFNDVTMTMKLQNAVSAVVNWRLSTALKDTWHAICLAEFLITCYISCYSLTVRSCVWWITELAKADTLLAAYFTAVVFLYVTHKIPNTGFTNELMDVLATVSGQRNSELSLSKVNKLKVVANGSQDSTKFRTIKPSSSTELNTSELLELLQQSAVQHLTTYRQWEARDFGSVVTIVTTDFEALYAYKHGDYQWCLQLSTQNVNTLLYAVCMPQILTTLELIQLLDDDIVSLTALTLIVNPSWRYKAGNVCISQLTLSLYLMTQCQLKLRHSVTSLAQTLKYIEVAQRRLRANRTLNQLTLKLSVRKALTYIVMMLASNSH